MFHIASVLLSLFVGQANAKNGTPVRVSVNQPASTAPAPSQNGAS